VRAADRAEPRGAVPARARVRGDRGGGADGGEGGRFVRPRGEVRRGGEHGEAARVGGILGRGGRVRADVRRLRVRGGVRRRAEVPRDAAVPSGARLDEPDPVVHRDPLPWSPEILLTAARGERGRGALRLESATWRLRGGDSR